MRTISTLLICVFITAAPAAQAGEPTFAGGGSIPADARDLLGETMGGFGSGGAYDATSKSYYFTSDRGPGDGTIDFAPRAQVITFHAPATSAGEWKWELKATIPYLDAQGKRMTGVFPDPAKKDRPESADGRTCVDPESLAIAPDGTIYFGEEYGPFIYQVSREGRELRVIRPPENYLPHDKKGSVDFSAQEKDEIPWGRTPNRGFEAMTLTPDGKQIVAILQSGLQQDGGKGSGVTRVLVLDAASGEPTAEYAYCFAKPDDLNAQYKLKDDDKLKAKDLAVCDIAAIGPTTFLALERDNRGLDGSDMPKPAVYKAVYRLELDGATNLLALPGKPFSLAPSAPGFRSLEKAADVKPVTKTLAFDIAAVLPEKDRATLPEKWETLAVAPRPEGGWRLLLANDNDFLTPVVHLAHDKDVDFKRAVKPQATLFYFFDLAATKK